MFKQSIVFLAFVSVLVACSSSTPASSSSPPPKISCAVIAVDTECAIHFAPEPSTPAACGTVPPDGNFVLNASSSSYTTASGEACSQTFTGCTIDRNCSGSTGAVQFHVTFLNDGTSSYSGKASVTASGVTCTYDVTGSTCS